VVFFFKQNILISDEDATNSSKDHLHEIGGPMTRSKIMRMNQALQSLIIKIKEKEGRYPLEVDST
jgi:hypothetical protein